MISRAQAQKLNKPRVSTRCPNKPKTYRHGARLNAAPISRRRDRTKRLDYGDRSRRTCEAAPFLGEEVRAGRGRTGEQRRSPQRGGARRGGGRRRRRRRRGGDEAARCGAEGAPSSAGQRLPYRSAESSHLSVPLCNNLPEKSGKNKEEG